MKVKGFCNYFIPERERMTPWRRRVDVVIYLTSVVG